MRCGWAVLLIPLGRQLEGELTEIDAIDSLESEQYGCIIRFGKKSVFPND